MIWNLLLIGTIADKRITSHRPKTHSRLHSMTSMSKNMMCIRVSTEQRGGIWAMGKRLFNGKVVLMLINQCSTLYDTLEVFEQVLKEVQ